MRYHHLFAEPVSGVTRTFISAASFCACVWLTKTDAAALVALAERVEALCEKDPVLREMPVTLAVMGCTVNGPGEARAADYGVALGDGVGMLFRKGEKAGTLPVGELVEGLIAMVKH